MPLALSRTARTLNTWTPNGQISIVGLNGTFKKDRDLHPSVDLLPDPVYLPQKAPAKFNATAAIFNGRGRRHHRRLNSAALQAIELNLAPYRHGAQTNGFAQEPKIKYQESPVARTNSEAAPKVVDPVNNSSPTLGVQSPSNQEVHFGAPGSLKRRRFSTAGVSTPVRAVCPDSGVQCASALFLTTGSPQSIGHLRKWNSQSDLGPDSQDFSVDPDLRIPERLALRRNASLPDLRLAEQLDATGLRRARPRSPPDPELQSPLMRSPSDTGRALCFWMEQEEGIRTFHDLPAQRRVNYEQKVALYRQQNRFSNGHLKLPSSKPIPSPSSPSKLRTEIDLLTLDPVSLAQELTQLSRELLLAIEPAELLTYVMKPRMAEMETCPNLHRLLQFYDRLAALVSSEILRHQTATKRAQILAIFIETADRCYALQNWQACCVLLSGIRSPPIVRLKDTWFQIRTEYPDHFTIFNRLVHDGNGPEDNSSEVELGGRPRPLAAVPYFGEIVAKVRARPTVQRLRPARALWKEPPSLAKWVDEQTSGATECDQCQSTLHKNRACCYLMVFVLGKNLFCPIRRMPLEDNCQDNLQESSVDVQNETNSLQRLHLSQLFDDPDSLPFTSRLVQCCALQPGNIVHIRQRVEIFLRTAQATARAYDLQSNSSTRHYWLHQPYSSMKSCMKRSIAVEPLSHSKQPQLL